MIHPRRAVSTALLVCCVLALASLPAGAQETKEDPKSDEAAGEKRKPEALKMAPPMTRPSPAASLALAEEAYDQGAYEKAVGISRALRSHLRRERAATDPAVIAVTRLLVRSMIGEDRAAGAESLARQHLQELERKLGPEHTETLLARLLVGRTLEAQDDRAAAEKLFREVRKFSGERKGETHTVTRMAVHALAGLEAGGGAEGGGEELQQQSGDVLLALRSAPRNLDFEAGDEGAIPEAWRTGTGDRSRGAFPVTTSEGCFEGERCALLTSLDGIERVVGLQFRDLLQWFDAKPFRGRSVRFSAAVRVAGSGAPDRAQLWMRVDREGDRVGFFENMDDRPILPGDWATYEIEARIHDDAEWIFLGVMVFGTQNAWMDDVRFEVVEEEASDADEPEEAARPAGGRSTSGVLESR